MLPSMDARTDMTAKCLEYTDLRVINQLDENAFLVVVS
jgi:hypothetical protein